MGQSSRDIHRPPTTRATPVCSEVTPTRPLVIHRTPTQTALRRLCRHKKTMSLHGKVSQIHMFHLCLATIASNGHHQAFQLLALRTVRNTPAQSPLMAALNIPSYLRISQRFVTCRLEDPTLLARQSNFIKTAQATMILELTRPSLRMIFIVCLSRLITSRQPKKLMMLNMLRLGWKSCKHWISKHLSQDQAQEVRHFLQCYLANFGISITSCKPSRTATSGGE